MKAVSPRVIVEIAIANATLVDGSRVRNAKIHANGTCVTRTVINAARDARAMFVRRHSSLRIRFTAADFGSQRRRASDVWTPTMMAMATGMSHAARAEERATAPCGETASASPVAKEKHHSLKEIDEAPNR